MTQIQNSFADSEEQVLAYLRHNPDFFVRHPDAILNLLPPNRWSGDDGQATVDFHLYLIERLRNDLDGVREAVDHLISINRENLSTQIRTHQAILSLLAAREISDLLRIIARDLPLTLDVTCVTLAVESGSLPLDALHMEGISHLASGRTEQLLAGATRYVLFSRAQGQEDVFTGQEQPILSSALIRLRTGGGIPAGLLALGTSKEGTFHPSQGTELLTFLARIIEICLKRLMG